MSAQDHGSPLDVPPPLPPDLGFHGDYYQGGDDVHRGVSMGTCSGSAYSFNSGDFYTEEDDTVRGVTMCGVPGQSSLLSKAAPNQWDYGMGLSEEPYGMPFQESLSQGAQERFQPGDQPKPLPTSQFFNLEQTTVHVKTDTPERIGNAMLDYLSGQVANILKTRRNKFWIKAEVFSGNVLCTTKITVWSTPEQEFAVEFQRKSGDGFAFGDMYRGACACLASHFPSMRGGPKQDVDRVMLPPPPPTADNDDHDMAPLFDMADMDECPALQAEAASAFAKIVASDDSKTAQLCQPNSLNHLQKLLKSDRLEVAYPTAQVLASLVAHEQAGHSFAEHGILQEMVAKVSAPKTTSIVQQEVAASVSTAAHRFAAQISASVAQDIQKSLDKAIKELSPDPAMESVRIRLQDAFVEFNQYCPAAGGP